MLKRSCMFVQQVGGFVSTHFVTAAEDTLTHEPGPNNFIEFVQYVFPIKVTSHKPN